MVWYVYTLGVQYLSLTGLYPNEKKFRHGGIGEYLERHNAFARMSTHSFEG